MAYFPVQRIPSTVEYEVATVSITKGDLLVQTAAGQITTTSVELTSAATLTPVAVAAETLDFTDTTLYPATLASSRKVLGWPCTPDVSWEVLCSGTPDLATIDQPIQCFESQVDTAGAGNFIIETLTDRYGEASGASNLYVIGRIQSKRYGANLS